MGVLRFDAKLDDVLFAVNALNSGYPDGGGGDPNDPPGVCRKTFTNIRYPKDF